MWSIVGGGWCGLLLAKELGARTSLSVVVLERGGPRKTADYFEGMDELDYAIRNRMMQDVSKETVTFRHTDPGTGRFRCGSSRLIPAGHRHGRIGRALERQHAAFSAGLLRDAHAHGGALWRGAPARRPCHAGLGHHVQRARALLHARGAAAGDFGRGSGWPRRSAIRRRIRRRR